MARPPWSAYRRGRVIGSGGYGQVFEAQGVPGSGGRAGTFAVKQVPAGGSPAARRSALVEAEVLARLEHPNVVRTYEAFLDTDGNVNFVMERAEGDLAQLLARLVASKGLVQKPAVLGMTHQLLAGLHYIHGQGVIHADLKPSNILIAADKVLKISDFGISRPTSSASSPDGWVGTASYTAPELCGGASPTFQSDVWALGCVVYEVAALQRAFPGDNFLAVVALVVAGQYPPTPQQYAPEVTALVDRMLTYDGNARPLPDALIHTFFPGDEPPSWTLSGLEGSVSGDEALDDPGSGLAAPPADDCVDWLAVAPPAGGSATVRELPGPGGPGREADATTRSLLSTSTTWVCGDKAGPSAVARDQLPPPGLDSTDRRLDVVIAHRQEFSASCFKAKLRAALDKGSDGGVDDGPAAPNLATPVEIVPAPTSARSDPGPSSLLEPVRLKVHYSRMNRTRVLSINPAIAFKEFQELLDVKPTKRQVSEGSFEAQYADEEGDWIALEDEADWAEMWFQYHCLRAAAAPPGSGGAWSIHVGPVSAAPGRPAHQPRTGPRGAAPEPSPRKKSGGNKPTSHPSGGSRR